MEFKIEIPDYDDRKGFVFKNAAKYQQYVCSKCGHPRRGSQNLLTKVKRDSLKRNIT